MLYTCVKRTPLENYTLKTFSTSMGLSAHTPRAAPCPSNHSYQLHRGVSSLECIEIAHRRGVTFISTFGLPRPACASRPLHYPLASARQA